MSLINLRKYYPTIYKEDQYIEVEELLALVLEKWLREERNYKERTRYHNAYYSLCLDDGIEASAFGLPKSAELEYEQQQARLRLYMELAKLPAAQARRIYARYIFGASVKEIAKAEKTSIKSVYRSILLGLKNINVKKL